MLDGQSGVDEILDQAVRAELDTSVLEAEAEQLLAEVECAAAAIDKLIEWNAKSILNQDEYTRRFNVLITRHAQLADQHEKLASKNIDKQTRLKANECYTIGIAKLGQAHSNSRPTSSIPSSTAPPQKKDGAIEFTFRDGKAI